MTRTESGVRSAAYGNGALTPPGSQAAPGQPNAPLSRRELREREAQQQPRQRIRSAASNPVAPRVPRAARAVTSSVGAKPPRIRRQKTTRGFMRTLTSMAAMAGVTAMLISTSISGSAFGPGDPVEAAQTLADGEIVSAEVQSLGVVTAPEGAVVEAVRDSYTAQAYVAPVKVPRFSSSGPGAGNPNFTYTNNPGGSIQWPFPTPAPITYGFGPRSACSYCSTYHLGVDFTPGSGVPIQAITAGTVSKVTLDGGGLGNHVTISHVVNGQRIDSVYAHMAWGSIQVAVGQQVSVGTIVGAVGSTGASTGAHLHLEIHADGTPIDPFAWLKANAN